MSVNVLYVVATKVIESVSWAINQRIRQSVTNNYQAIFVLITVFTRGARCLMDKKEMIEPLLGLSDREKNKLLYNDGVSEMKTRTCKKCGAPMAGYLLALLTQDVAGFAYFKTTTDEIVRGEVNKYYVGDYVSWQAGEIVQKERWGGSHPEGAPISKVGQKLWLLIVDVGESCVVKVERGDNSYLFYTYEKGCDKTSYRLETGKTHTIHCSFDKLKAVIDAHFAAEKPVPRIERYGVDYKSRGLYRLIFDNSYKHVDQAYLDNLNELARQAGAVADLLIWRGGAGTWTQIYPAYER